MSVRRAVLITLLATAVVGGTAAAAEIFDGRIGEPVVDETPTTEAPDVTTTTVAGDEGEAPDEEGEDPDGEAPDDSTERWYEDCGDFTEGTHGDYVSQAAHADDATGASVSEAAKSPCGKPVSSVHTEPTDEEPVEAPDDGATVQGRGQSGASHGASGSAPGHTKKP
jgi:hypothetical protein